MPSIARALLTASLLLTAAGCATAPFQTGKPSTPSHTTTSGGTSGPGAGPSVPPSPGSPTPEAGTAAPVEAAPPAPLPKERPAKPPATLGAASKALVGQAQAQRKKGDLPGATVSLERALRIEPSNPLLWIEMGRLRMDQRNYPQAEAMGRKALSMSIGDVHTQASAWQLIADSLKARGKNQQAQEAQDRAKALQQM